MKTASWENLIGTERLIARIERTATHDTVWGGAKALLYANRLKRMGGTDLTGVVADVYSASTGSRHRQHGAWECPECGNACLGIEAAFDHCNCDNAIEDSFHSDDADERAQAHENLFPNAL